MRNVFGCPGQAGDNQKILGVLQKFGDSVAAIERPKG